MEICMTRGGHITAPVLRPKPIENQERGEKQMANQADYIEPGSKAHAAFLGLKKAAEKDIPQYEGWTLVDPTQWGPMARPEFLEQILKQKFNEWKIKPEVSEKAPSMWVPSEAPVSGIV